MKEAYLVSYYPFENQYIGGSLFFTQPMFVISDFNKREESNTFRQSKWFPQRYSPSQYNIYPYLAQKYDKPRTLLSYNNIDPQCAYIMSGLFPVLYPDRRVDDNIDMFQFQCIPFNNPLSFEKNYVLSYGKDETDLRKNASSKFFVNYEEGTFVEILERYTEYLL